MWRRFSVVVLFLSVTAGPGRGLAAEAAAWSALRQGGYVALMRHADAPGGAGDPPGFRLEDCATQRNLSEKGRADAKAMGARLAAEGIAIRRLLSSPWCRCLETARLLEMGPIEIEPTFSNAFVLRDQLAALTQGARAIVANWAGPGTLLVVTHGANIQALTGYSPASGELVVVAPGPDAALRRIGTIAPADR
jgi:phosphohistidine phosphatase SixA